MPKEPIFKLIMVLPLEGSNYSSYEIGHAIQFFLGNQNVNGSIHYKEFYLPYFTEKAFKNWLQDIFGNVISPSG